MPNFTARDRLKLLAGGGAAALFSACGGGGSSSPTSPPVNVTPPIPPTPTPASAFELTAGQYRQTFSGKFAVGAAIQNGQVGDGNSIGEVIKDQMNSITAEYEMKPEFIAPTEGNFDWTVMDTLVDFAEANNMAVRGHALVWYQSTPDYFFEGTPAEVKTRLETYITEVVSRYAGRIFAWDVVNEAITDSDSAADPYRKGSWWDASGGNADYIDWAFQAARAADPSCLLFINDYSTELAAKRGRYIEVIKDLIARDIPLDGVGHQMHLNIETHLANVVAALDAIDNEFMGLDQHITELDVSLYIDPGSCYESQINCSTDYNGAPPASVMTAQAELYRGIFEDFAARASVKSVTTWGVSDSQSWLNGFPADRTNAPLLWDRAFAVKPALQAILDPDFTP